MHKLNTTKFEKYVLIIHLNNFQCPHFQFDTVGLVEKVKLIKIIRVSNSFNVGYWVWLCFIVYSVDYLTPCVARCFRGILFIYILPSGR